MDAFETTIYNAVLITGFVIGAIILYFAISMFRNHRKHFRLLSRQFKEEITLLEKERTRIARDLHDELGPLLAVAKIHINAIEDSSDEARQHLEIADKNIDTLSERFAGIARNLTPMALAAKGLQTALEDFIEQYNRATAIRIRLFYNLSHKHSMSLTLHIYRIVQELIHNGVKHSEAKHMEIRLAEKKGKLYVSYKDDGKGIPPTQHPGQKEGIGMSSLKNRAEMLGGKMQLFSRPREGTEYFFEIPITQEI